MRTLATVFALLAFSLPAAAGPMDSWEYRSALGAMTTWGTGPGPVAGRDRTSYVMDYSPLFGVVTSWMPEWERASPAYPSANFALVFPGALTPYIAPDPPFPEVSGSGRFRLDLEIRDADGRVGMATFLGNFSAGWWGDHGYADPVFDTIPGSDGAGIPPQLLAPSASIWLGRTRYDVRLHYGSGGPYYTQDADGNWYPGFFAADSIPYPSGTGYWTEDSGSFYAEITPTATPEPGTLALAGIGLCGLLAGRRVRRIC